MLPQAASEQYRIQQAIGVTTTAAVARLWSRMGDDFDDSWERVGPQIVGTVEAGRRSAVANALPYTSRVLRETGQSDSPIGVLNADMFLSTAPDGRDLESLYGEAVIKAKASVAGGALATDARAVAGRWLTMASLTVLADTRREVYSADIGQRANVAGYIRMVNGRTCRDCIVLAGRWYRWNAGFERHPRCDCHHVPAPEARKGEMATDPYETFNGMSPEEQERVFGRIEARAIRDGADIYRVVNTANKNRGLGTAAGARRAGRAPTRMTIDDIYRTAGTRSNAIRMMREQGYLLERGQVSRSLAPGVRTDRQILAAGRGRGTVTINGATITTGRAARFDAAHTGQRNVLTRSTMTAAERRLFDAEYRLRMARTTGRVPRSVGPSTADVNATPIIATPAEIVRLERALAREVAKLRERGTPESVRRLARALGLI